LQDSRLLGRRFEAYRESNDQTVAWIAEVGRNFDSGKAKFDGDIAGNKMTKSGNNVRACVAFRMIGRVEVKEQ